MADGVLIDKIRQSAEEFSALNTNATDEMSVHCSLHKTEGAQNVAIIMQSTQRLTICQIPLFFFRTVMNF